MRGSLWSGAASSGGKNMKHWWIISVHGYGEFNFFGTEHEAEDMRRHKANWERAVARKRRGRLVKCQQRGE